MKRGWLFGLAAVCACEPPPPTRSAAKDAAPDAKPDATLAREEIDDGLGPGCRRSGAFAAIEADPSCVVPRANPDETSGVLRQLALTLSTDTSETLGGGQVALHLSLTNTGKRPAAIVLEGEPPGAGPHHDWALLTGVAPPRAAQPDEFRTRFVVRTLDARDRSVDQMRLLPPAVPPPLRLYRVVLAPRAQLTHTFTWMAMGIPAPYPPFEDDAGHRIVPKTAPRALSAGKYTIEVEVPLYGVTTSQRIVTTPITVVTAS